MKGKSLFFLGSVVAAALLVGGTFAAWAVTDNADPFSVTITPETVEIGDDKSVTLDWGTKGLINIESLSVGEEKGPYALGLKATTSDNSAFSGSLLVKLETTATASEKLIDYLEVNVYDNNTKTGDPLLTVPDGSANYTVAKDIVVNSGEEKIVYFYVALDGGLNPAIYNQIKNDVVTLTVDWNKGSGIEEITSRTYYYWNKNSWSHVYVYAWNSSTLASNAEWPGVEMTQVKDDIYTVALDVQFDYVIFTNNNGSQTTDLEIDPAKPYYHDAWVDAPDLSAEVEYYLVGTFNEWMISDAYKLSADDSKEGYSFSIKNVDVPENSDLKIVSSENVWFAENSNENTAPNFHIGEANHYDFYFAPAGNAGTYIFCEAHA